MRWYRNLYLGPNAACNIQKIRENAATGKWMASVYYITLASTEGNLLDIFHNTMLKQALFARTQRTDIVGVAEGRAEAVELVQKIIGDVYEQTGGFDMASFFHEEDFHMN
jgi:hypothetical protein